MTLDELDYIALIMYKEKRNIQMLEYNDFIKDFCLEKEKEEPKKEENTPDIQQKPTKDAVQEEQNYDDNFETEEKEEKKVIEETKEEENTVEKQEVEKERKEEAKVITQPEKAPPKKSSPKKKKKQAPPKKVQEEQQECANLNDDEMIEVAQGSFYKIACLLAKAKTTIPKLYENVIVKKVIEGEEQDVITSEDFINGIKSLGKEEFQSIEYVCLIKVLAISEEDKIIRVADLLQIISDYKMTGEEAGSEKPKTKGNERNLLNFEILDEVSMILMLALAEFILKEQIPLLDLFESVVFKKTIKKNSRQKEVELIKSSDFFEVLSQVGIKTEENEHENLKQFLCLNSKENDLIWVKKLTLAVQEFSFNEELREIAHKCYEAFVGGEEGGIEDQESDRQQQPKKKHSSGDRKNQEVI